MTKDRENYGKILSIFNDCKTCKFFMKQNKAKRKVVIAVRKPNRTRDTRVKSDTFTPYIYPLTLTIIKANRKQGNWSSFQVIQSVI